MEHFQTKVMNHALATLLKVPRSIDVEVLKPT